MTGLTGITSASLPAFSRRLLGAWRLDPTHPASGPFVLRSSAATEFYIDSVERAMTRSANGILWRTYLKVDPASHTLLIEPYEGKNATYTWRTPDANHLVLTSVPPGQPTQRTKAAGNAKPAQTFTPEVITLTRIPIPTQYPLYSTKFKWVSYY